MTAVICFGARIGFTTAGLLVAACLVCGLVGRRMERGAR